MSLSAAAAATPAGAATAAVVVDGGMGTGVVVVVVASVNRDGTLFRRLVYASESRGDDERTSMRGSVSFMMFCTRDVMAIMRTARAADVNGISEENVMTRVSEVVAARLWQECVYVCE